MPSHLPSPLDRVLEVLVGAVQRAPDLPGWTAWALCAAGVGVLLFGARSRRPLAIAGGALVGWLAGAAASSWLLGEVGVSPLASRIAFALLVGVAAGLAPAVFLFAAGAFPAALLAMALGGGAFATWMGVALGGVGGLLLRRKVAAAAAAVIGAALLAWGVAAAAGSLASLRILVEHPAALGGLAAVLAVAGAAFQLDAAWPAPAEPFETASSTPVDDQAPTVFEDR